MNRLDLPNLIVAVLALVEAAVTLLFLVGLNKFRKIYSQLRTNSLGRLDAFEQALGQVIPVFAARLITVELRIYSTIIGFITRKTAHEEQFLSLRGSSRFMLQAIAFISAIEIAVIEFAIPNKYLLWKVLLLVLTVWAMVYIAGLYLSTAREGHVLLDDGIKLQVGLGLKGFIPYERISSIVERREMSPSFKTAPYISKEKPTVLYAIAGDDCNVTITLNEEVVLDGLMSKFKPINLLHLSLEEPARFVELVEGRRRAEEPNLQS